MKASTYTIEQERQASQLQGDGLLDIGLGLALLIVGLAMFGDWSMSFVGIQFLQNHRLSEIKP